MLFSFAFIDRYIRNSTTSDIFLYVGPVLSCPYLGHLLILEGTI